ncbi:MAG: HNH endonuclease [Candidatus Hodarchaeota archaeon]
MGRRGPTAGQKKWARIRDNHRCQICGDVLPVPYGRLEVHHIVHRRKGGTNDLENLTTLCDLCHAVTHDHMGPAWVGLSEFPREKQEQLRPTLNRAKEEFESYLRLPIEQRRRIQIELWAEWGIT